MTKSKKRKEFERIKRRKGFYTTFGGKDKRKQIHHKRMLSRGGNNSRRNLVYLFSWLHTLYHHLLSRGEIDQVRFRGQNPSLEKQCDDLADGCIAKIRQNMYIEDVRKHFKSMERER